MNKFFQLILKKYMTTENKSNPLPKDFKPTPKPEKVIGHGLTTLSPADQEARKKKSEEFLAKASSKPPPKEESK